MQVKFGSWATFDLGASDRYRGHLRVKLLDDAGNPIGKPLDGPACDQPFQQSDDLITGIGQLIAKAYQQAQAILPVEDKLKGVIGFVPAQTKNNIVAHFANLETQSGQKLANVNFNDLVGILKEHGVKLAAKPKVVVTNDMMGGTAFVASKLAGEPTFKEGFHGVYMATGGGFGVAELTYEEGDKLKIKATENGHLTTTGNVSLEASVASAPAIINNFAKALGLDDKTRQTLVAAGDARVVTQLPKAQAVLPRLTERQHKQAGLLAMNQYLDGVSTLIANKVLDGINTVVLAGPLAHGVKHSVETNPKDFQSDLDEYALHHSDDRVSPFEKVLINRVWNRLDETGQTQFRVNRLQLKTDLEVNDNTAGSWYLSQGHFVGEHVRGNWFSIPVKAFQTATESGR
jgi:hypothetical protein